MSNLRFLFIECLWSTITSMEYVVFCLHDFYTTLSFVTPFLFCFVFCLFALFSIILHVKFLGSLLTFTMVNVFRKMTDILEMHMKGSVMLTYRDILRFWFLLKR